MESLRTESPALRQGPATYEYNLAQTTVFIPLSQKNIARPSERTCIEIEQNKKTQDELGRPAFP